MQPRVKTTICLTILFLTGLWICSCGDVQLLDPMDDTYQVSFSVDGSSDIDVIQSDCDGTPQDFFGEIGSLTIASSLDAPYLRITSYMVEYIPQLSSARDGTWAVPVALGQTANYPFTIEVNPGDTVSPEEGLPDVMSIGIKDNYATDLDGFLYFAQGIYTLRLHLYGNQSEKAVELTADTVVRLMDVACQ